VAPAPVVIVGGGPVGLSLAAELAHHGTASVVLERRAEVSWLRPRAKTTSARTMEHLRRWGVAAELRRRAPLAVDWCQEVVFCTSVTGREITRFDRCFGLDLVGSELVAEAGQQVGQPLVEQVLREFVQASERCELVTPVEVISVTEHDDEVVVEAREADGTVRTFHAPYVVGCDGATSVVREAMGAHYVGAEDGRPNLNMVFRAPGLVDKAPHGPAIHYWVLNPRRPGVVGPLDLDGLWWCGAAGVDPAVHDVDPAALICELLGIEIDVEVLSTDAWRARMLLADTYSKGRLFLAGDAAHQNPPWGGHGFNTGVGDAVNLGWKLAAVLGGWAPPALLDSYGDERMPIEELTIDVSRRNMSVLTPELADPRLFGTDEEFAEVLPEVAAAVQATKFGEFHSLSLVLGYHYEGSPIVAPDTVAVAQAASHGDNSEDEYVPSAAPGHRLPHFWLDAATSVYDALGDEFTVIGDTSDQGVIALVNAASALGIPAEVLHVDATSVTSRFGAPIVVVRPDQHVAWRGIAPDDAARTWRIATGADQRAEARVGARRAET
jgi:2-polyprenyl-6-methoxyphenol hydroxylase-like FAD-dependent oxidoreductase